MSIERCLAGKGKRHAIYELKKDGESTLKKFMMSLSKSDQGSILGLVRWIAENGKPRDKRKFKPQEDGIFAIKDFQVRIYCFLDKDDSIILTNGALKKDDDADPEDLKKAKQLRKEYKRRTT